MNSCADTLNKGPPADIALLVLLKNSCVDALSKEPPADTEAVVVESVRPLREPMALSSYVVGAAEEGQVGMPKM